MSTTEMAKQDSNRMEKKWFVRVVWFVAGSIALIVYETIPLVIEKSLFNKWVMGLFYMYNIGFFFFLTFCFFPKVHVLFKSKVAKLVVWIGCLIAYTLVSLAITGIIVYLYTGQLKFGYEAIVYYKVASRGLLFFVMALSYWYARYSIDKIKEAKDAKISSIESEKRELAMENAFLQSQMDAHFTRNVLTGLYGRLSTKAPQEAATLLLFSEMMDYSLQHSSEGGKASLTDDLNQIVRLVELHQDLHDQELQVLLDFEVPEADRSLLIPPSLFMDYVQNVFKYGKLDDEAHPATISLKSANGQLWFSTWNLIAGAPYAQGLGIGHRNTRRRLEKHFGARYRLQAGPDKNEYKVSLNIFL